MAITILAHNAVPAVPRNVAVCPICGADIGLEIDEWERQEDGSWAAGEDGTHPNCTTEPEIGSDGWDDWMSSHWAMPYVDWLPVDVRVYGWLLENYRFEE